MNAALNALIAKVEAAAPMSNGVVPIDRTLLVDGDGLCYYCAGNDETSAGQARVNLLDKVQSAARAAGCGRIKILLTSRGSDKGKRFAVASVKPYQGQRTSSRRPANWQFLRTLLETGLDAVRTEVVQTSISEADDLFAVHAAQDPNCVIYTQDKDMRMIPGSHLDWLTHIITVVPKGTWELVSGDKVYGRKWFWMQMLHGDTADNIPGLEFYTDGSIVGSGPNKGKLKEIRCGEKSTAVAGLDKHGSDMAACIYLQGLYRTCYGEDWLVRMLEQGVLLWMRPSPTADLLDVCAPGHPLHPLTTHRDYPQAEAWVMSRCANYEPDAETEDDGSGDSADSTADEPAREVCTVPVAMQEAGAGPLPFNGTSAGDLVQRVQCVAGACGEQPQEVRSPIPTSVPPWLRAVLAKA